MSKFTARNVKDRIVEFPQRYELKSALNGASLMVADLVPAPGEVVQSGTPMNKAFQQPVEDWLANTPSETPTAGGLPIAPDSRREIGLWANSVELKAALPVSVGCAVKMTDSGVAPLGPVYTNAASYVDSGAALPSGSLYCGECDDDSFVAVRQTSEDKITLFVCSVDNATGLVTLQSQATLQLPQKTTLRHATCEVVNDVGLLLLGHSTGSWSVPFKLSGRTIASFGSIDVLTADPEPMPCFAKTIEGRPAQRFVFTTVGLLHLVVLSDTLSALHVTLPTTDHKPSYEDCRAQVAWLNDKQVVVVTIGGSGATFSSRCYNVGAAGLTAVGLAQQLTINAAYGKIYRMELVSLTDGQCLLAYQSYTGSTATTRNAQLVTGYGEGVVVNALSSAVRHEALKPLPGNQVMSIYPYTSGGKYALRGRVYSLSGTSLTPVGSEVTITPMLTAQPTCYPLPRNGVGLLALGSSYSTARWVITDNSSLIGFACENIAPNGRGLVAVGPGRLAAVKLPVGATVVYLLGGTKLASAKPYAAAKPVGVRDSDGSLILTGNQLC